MKNYEEIKSVLLEQGYIEYDPGYFKMYLDEEVKSVTITNELIEYGIIDLKISSFKTEYLLSVNNIIEAFAIVHMLIYVGAIDAKKVFSKQLKGIINESVI